MAVYQPEEDNTSTPPKVKSCFTSDQANAIWGVIQHLAKEQHKNPKKVWHRDEVFELINDEMI